MLIIYMLPMEIETLGTMTDNSYTPNQENRINTLQTQQIEVTTILPLYAPTIALCDISRR